MSTACFYLPPENWGAEPLLQGQEARHLGQVLRLRAGEEVTLLDGCGRKGRCSILEVRKQGVRLRLLTEEREPPCPAPAIVALAFSKAVRRGFFMEKAVELGAHAIWLWQGDHSQGKLSSQLAETCRGQMVAGAKQSGNPWLPDVQCLTGGVEELVERAAPVEHRILPWEMQEGIPMLTSQQAGRPGLSLYVIGPEGGFSQRELAALRQAAFIPVSLGARILRCETAATLCLGIHWWAAQQPGRITAGDSPA